MQFRAGPPQEQSFFGPCLSWQHHCDGTERANDSYFFILYAFDMAKLDIPEPMEVVNFVSTLDLHFQENAITSTELKATSDASPSCAPMCPDVGIDAGAGDAEIPSGDAGDAMSTFDGGADSGSADGG